MKLELREIKVSIRGLSLALFLMTGLVAVAQDNLKGTGPQTPQSEQKSDAPADPEDMTFDDLAELSLEELLNLKVTVASKRAERISDAAGVISVITKEELENFGGITLRDILERVPSLIGMSAAFTERYGVASRGDQTKINSGHILLLINGRPTREVVEGGISSEMYAAFPVNIIDRIEVIRGPGSVLYGSNAFSSVINVVTENAEENNFAVSALTGTAGAFGANGEAKLKFGDLTITGAGRYMDKGSLKMPYTAVMYDPITFLPLPPEYTTVTMTDKSKSVYVDAKYKGLSFMGSHNEYEANYFQFGAFYQGLWKKNFGNFGYDTKVSDSWDMNFNFTYNFATLDSDIIPDIKRESHDIVAEWTNHISVTDNLSLVVGGLYNKVKGSEETVLLGEKYMVANKSRGNIAFYTQADYWMFKNLKLIAGMQANKVDEFDLDIVPRGGVIWYPASRINVKGLYSQAYRAASVDEFSMNYPNGLFGNKDLKPEKVATVDLGVNYIGEKIQGGVNVFQSKMSNSISPVFIPGEDPLDPFTGGITMYMNQGETTFKGVEFEFKYYLTRNLFLTGSTLYQKSESDTAKNVTPIANFSAKAGISYKFGSGVTISLFDIYQGKLDDKYTKNAFNPNPQAGSYNLLNLYASADLVKLFRMNTDSGISLFVQANNILDKEVWIHDYSSSFPGSTTPVNPGRTIYAGVNFSLK